MNQNTLQAKITAAAIFVVATLFAACASQAQVAQSPGWWQFRGEGGVSVGASPVPTEFDDKKNIAWKTKMPGKGASSPIVVDGKVIVTCSGGENQDQLYTVAIDAATGKTAWTQKFWATGRCFVHPLSANAAPTPASDGKHIVAFFSSNDLACLDLDGNLLWYRGLAVDYEKAGNDVGMASSPVVHDGVVVVQVECQGDSFAMGLDVENGTTIWKQDRAKDAVWTSPLLVKPANADAASNSTKVLLQSKDSFDLLDIKTGEQVFRAEGSVSSISSPAQVGGRVYVPINGTTAFSIDSSGELKQEWNSEEIRPSSMSSVIHDGSIYTLNRAGALYQYNANDGTETSKARVISGSSAWATPVVAGEHMYVFAQGGQAYVVKLGGDKPEVVNSHVFKDEVFLGSPAIDGDALFVRSDKFLWKIAEQN